ncbi:7496_t:CDS:1, partial [Diversispora eburnea]
TLSDWHYHEEEKKKGTILYQQHKEAKAHNQTLSEEIRFPKYRIHPGASYYSKSINTKQITQLLEIFNVVLPKVTTFDFTALKSEIEKLKAKEKELEELRQQSSSSLMEQLKKKKSGLKESLDELKNNLKEKLDSKELGLLLDTLLEIRVNIIEEGNDSLAEEKFESLASILEKKISENFAGETKKIEEELERLYQIQKEITYLDEIIQSKSIQ